jgi:predicted HicB family RNase H-like nuclease
MSPTGKNKRDFRLSLDKELYQLVKRIAAVSDVSMNAFINRAIENYVETDEIQEVVQRYNLEDGDE